MSEGTDLIGSLTCMDTLIVYALPTGTYSSSPGHAGRYDRNRL